MVQEFPNLRRVLGLNLLEAHPHAGTRIAGLRELASPTHGTDGLDRLAHVGQLERHFYRRPDRTQVVRRDEEPPFREVFGKPEIKVRLALERHFELDVSSRMHATHFGAPRPMRRHIARRVGVSTNFTIAGLEFESRAGSICLDHSFFPKVETSFEASS